MPASPPKPVCIHCASPIPASEASAQFCCRGCEAVYSLLHEQGLGRYYELARGARLPSEGPAVDCSRAWLLPLLSRAEAQARGPVCALDLDVQGVQCAACVWLIQELSRRRTGGRIAVNAALGKARLTWSRGAFDVRAFVSDVERFGYRLGPSRKTSARPGELPLRLGVTLAASMNVMLFSFSFYFGLAPSDARTFSLFGTLSLLLSTVVVLVGGWPFFRGAVQALRRGMLHLDLPIALGILLVWGTSVAQALSGRYDHTYLDTLCTFVALMLLGRSLQERVLEKNRAYLLQDGGADGLVVRRREGSALATVAAPLLRTGDRLWLAPGDLLPVDAALDSPAGSFSLDWITGESRPLAVARGERVGAGSFNAGQVSVELIALQPFADSALPALLAASPVSSLGTAEAQGPEGAQSAQRPASTRAVFFDRFARYYAVAVLGLATFGFFLWLPQGLARAIDIAAALLVVTCPCAIGLALPLAQQLVCAAARRAGVCIRSPDLLDRLAQVHCVLFDKTGTLTLGHLALVEPSALRLLPVGVRDAATNLSARSNHPVSRAVSEALFAAGGVLTLEAQLTEVPGLGVLGVCAGEPVRFGKPSWVCPGQADVPGVALLAISGVARARFETREAIRPGVRQELLELRERGLALWLLSGDAEDRVKAFASDLGFEKERVAFACAPRDKARLVHSHWREGTLFVGDGVNDALAFAAASCAGTPAIDRPVMPSRADFYLLGSGLGGLARLFDSAHHLRTITKRVLALAFAYNALAITASLAGLLTPLAAAIAMPSSSLSILLYVLASLKQSPRHDLDASTCEPLERADASTPREEAA